MRFLLLPAGRANITVAMRCFLSVHYITEKKTASRRMLGELRSAKRTQRRLTEDAVQLEPACMSGIARGRLAEERKAWRKDHPYGFFAKPVNNDDGSLNIMKWNCGIPGKKGTIFEGGVFPLTIEFTEDYPTKGPTCKFPAGFYHPNIFPSGTVCLSILTDDWKPSITVKQMLLGIQDLLDSPNEHSPAQEEAYKNYVYDKTLYRKKTIDQTKKYTPTS